MRDIITGVLLLLTFCEHAHTQQRENLKGEKGVQLNLALGSVPDEANMSNEALKTEAELRLRRSGILIREGAGGNETWPALSVYIDVLRVPNSEVYAVWIRVELTQLVTIIQSNRVAAAGTWSSGSLQVLGTQRLLSGVKEQIGSIVDQFCKDFLAANPKR